MSHHVIRDRIWDSKKLARCSRDAALAYPWVYLVADAWGRFEYNPRRIWTKVFGNREDVTFDDVARWLTEYESVGLLFRYHLEGDLAVWMGFYGRATKKRQPSQYPDPEPFIKKAFKRGRTSAPKSDHKKSGRTLAPMDKEKDKERDREYRLVEFYNGLTGRRLSEAPHQKAIAPLIESGVSPVVLKLAVVGACLKPFHLGFNERKAEYLDPETIFRPARFDGHAEYARRATFRMPEAELVWQFWMPRLHLSRVDVIKHFFATRDRLLVEEGLAPLGPAAAFGDGAVQEWPESA